MLIQAFLLGMLGSLAANIITEPTKQIIAQAENVRNIEDSKIMGLNKNAVVFVSMLLVGSALYLYSKDR